jgi:hypothetical protein
MKFLASQTIESCSELIIVCWQLIEAIIQNLSLKRTWRPSLTKSEFLASRRFSRSFLSSRVATASAALPLGHLKQNFKLFFFVAQIKTTFLKQNIYLLLFAWSDLMNSYTFRRNDFLSFFLSFVLHSITL